MTRPDEHDRKQREQTFHDHRYTDDMRRVTRRYYDVDRGRARYRERVVDRVDPGERILEYGCGTGSLARLLADRGGRVTGIDLSSVAVARANARAGTRKSPTAPRFVQMDAERLAFADGSFDLVCGSAILHHLDLPLALAEVSRVLARDGSAVFVEPLGHNPAINAYRRLTPRLRTADERPLRQNDLRVFERFFREIDTEYFDLTALAGALLGHRAPGVVDRLHRLDAWLLARSALARRWAWMVLITVHGPVRGSSTR